MDVKQSEAPGKTDPQTQARFARCTDSSKFFVLLIFQYCTHFNKFTKLASVQKLQTDKDELVQKFETSSKPLIRANSTQVACDKNKNMAEQSSFLTVWLTMRTRK